MTKLSSDQYNEIVKRAFEEEMQKISAKIPFSGGMNIPHGNIKNFLKDITSSERYNILDTMKYAPGVKSLRSSLAQDIVNKRKGVPTGLPTKLKAKAAQGLRGLSVADAPVAAALFAAPVPATGEAYVGLRAASSKVVDVAKKKGWIKPSPDLRPLAKRDPNELKNIAQANKMKAFNEEIGKLDLSV